jgi:hypothetical protein
MKWRCGNAGERYAIPGGSAFKRRGRTGLSYGKTAGKMPFCRVRDNAKTNEVPGQPTPQPGESAFVRFYR